MNRDIFTDDAMVGVYGIGITGISIAQFLRDRAIPVLLFDDNPSSSALKIAKEMGLDIHIPTSDTSFEKLIKTVTVFMPTPGLPDKHPVYERIDIEVPVCSEFDLVAEFDDRPLTAITGTNGKTTVTMMVKEMLLESGIKSEAVGNTEIPLVKAIADKSIQKFVVEASSFRLGHSVKFEPNVSAWLNFTPDHLDVHRDLESYEMAKAAIWSNQSTSSTAIGNCEDVTVMRHIPETGNVKTFGINSGSSKVVDEFLVIDNEKLLPTQELKCFAPHDIMNALAAATIAESSGAEIEAIKKVLREFDHLPHRIAYIGRKKGVEWYNDSKSTTPHSVVAAVQGFENVILLVGGRNKGLDLDVMGSVKNNLKRVIVMGEASDELLRVFEGSVPTSSTNSMEDAIKEADLRSEEGDVVLLSPGCTSFDWYKNYVERGEHFERAVNELIGVANGDN